MKSVTSVQIEPLHRGIVLILTTKEKEIVTLQFSKFEARQLALRLLRMLGTKRGEGD